MNIGILGTGTVGETIGAKLIELGHTVKLGSRSASNEKAAEWAAQQGTKASVGTFAEAAAFGELLFNCTNGNGCMDALASAGEENLRGKVLIDVSNPLDFSNGFPPSLTVCNTDSLAEQLQRAHPTTRVVKSLNTVTAAVMVNPALLAAETDIFVSGEDAEAKAQVTAILRDWFGWKSVIDLGGISTARAVEAWLLLWVNLMGPMGGPLFNLKLIRK
ncbi:MAG: NAD(P)-binding domain-containing protein [Anaerolineales bacterium]